MTSAHVATRPGVLEAQDVQLPALAPLAGTITDRITLIDVPAAFDRMRRGDGGRAPVVFPPRHQEA
jgi:hypothetical protein